jgi:hypothetical protein
MKRLLLAGFALLAIATSCNKVKQLANINVDIPYTQQLNLPDVAADTAGAGLPAGGLSVPLPSVSFATNSQQYMSQYHTAAGMILNVYLKGLSLQLAAPPNQNFDWLDNIQVYISAPGQPEVLIASQDNVPKGQALLSLNTNTSVNLKSYFVQDTITMRMQAHINAIPASSTQVNIASVFHLLANPLD